MIKTQLKHLCKNEGKDKAIIFLHGYGANMHDLAPLAQFLDTENNYTWYFPDAPLDIPFDPYGSAKAWFPLDQEALEAAMKSGTFRDFKNNSTPELTEAVNKTLQLVRDISSNHKEVLIGGFSQGGMVSLNAMAMAPNFFQGLVLHQDRWHHNHQ